MFQPSICTIIWFSTLNYKTWFGHPLQLSKLEKFDPLVSSKGSLQAGSDTVIDGCSVVTNRQW